MPLNRTDKNIQFVLKVLQLCKHVHYDNYNEDEKKFYHLNIISEAQSYGQEAITEFILNSILNLAKLHGADTDFFLYELLHTTSLEQDGGVSLDEFTLNGKTI